MLVGGFLGMAVERICEPRFYSSVTKYDERFYYSRSIRDSSQDLADDSAADLCILVDKLSTFRCQPWLR